MFSRYSPSILAMAVCLGVAATGTAFGQCILANPSFEIGGAGGQIFGGWNQFGAVGSVTETVHGYRAARVRGPDSGSWDVSGFWQSQDCEPGEQTSLISGIELLARKHEVWVGIPENHDIAGLELPAKMLYRYEDLDQTLASAS